jgi:hypothetical protein
MSERKSFARSRCTFVSYPQHLVTFAITPASEQVCVCIVCQVRVIVVAVLYVRFHSCVNVHLFMQTYL